MYIDYVWSNYRNSNTFMNLIRHHVKNQARIRPFHHSSMDSIMNSSERAIVHIFRYQLFFTSLTHFTQIRTLLRVPKLIMEIITMLQLAHAHVKLCIYRSTFP